MWFTVTLLWLWPRPCCLLNYLHSKEGPRGTTDAVDLFKAPSVAKAVPAPTMLHLHHLFLLKPLACQMTRVLPVCWKKWLSWNNVCRPVALLVESWPIKLRSVLQANTVDGLGTLVGASGGVAVTSAVTRPVVLTKEALLIWRNHQKVFGATWRYGRGWQ